MSLFSQFEQFWAHAEGRSERQPLREPLLHVAEYWEFWKKQELLADEEADLKGAICSLATNQQERFVAEIENWGRNRAQDFPSSVGWIVLHQLSEIPEFANWAALASYRPSGLKGVNAVVLQPLGAPAAEDVKPIRVVLLKQGAAVWGYYPHNADFDRDALPDVRRAVTNCLGGSSFPAFVLSWAILGWTLRRSAARLSVALSAGIALISVAVARSWSPLPRSLLHASLWILVIAVVGLLVIALVALVRERSAARRQLNRLNGARAVIVLGGDSSGPRLQVYGASFGAALYLSTLQALYQDDPKDDSALAWCAKVVSDRLPATALTGKLTNSGQVQRVCRLKHKISACEKNSAVSTLFVPCQKIPNRRNQTGRSALGIHRLPPFVPLPIASLHPGIRAYLIAAAVLLTTGVLALACFDAWRILDPPAAPRIRIEESGFFVSPKAEDMLRISFVTPSSSRFGVRLNSRYWANRWKEISRDSSGVSNVDLHMDKLRQPMVWDKYDGEVETAYSPTFLGRPLDVVVEKMLLERIVVPGWDIGHLDRQ